MQRTRLLNSKSVLFDIAITAWVIARMIKSLAIADELSAVANILTPLSIGVLILFELTSIDASQPINWIPLLVVLALCPSALFGQNTVLAQGVIFAVCARSIDFYILSKKLLRAYIALLVTVIMLSQCNILPDNIVIVSERIRSSLGFIWPSRPPNVLLTISCLYVFIKKENCKLWTIGTLFLCNIGLFIVTGSRNPFIFTLVLLCLAVALKSCSARAFIAKCGFVVTPIFLLCAFISVILCWNYDPSIEWMNWLNTVTTRRLYLSHLAFESVPFTLFGTDFFVNAESEVGGFLDSSYLQLWFHYGVIAFLAITILWTALIKRSIKSGDVYLAAVLVCLALHGVLEGQLIVLEYTPFMLLYFHDAKRLRQEMRGNAPGQVESGTVDFVE